MIKSISLKNFKSWIKMGPVNFCPITGFFGANSAGKSSLIQVLLLLKQTVDSSDRAMVLNMGDEKSLIEFGSLTDVAYNHKSENGIGWSIKWDLKKELSISDTSNPKDIILKTNMLFFDAEVISNGQSRMLLNFFHYKSNGQSFGIQKLDNGKYKFEVQPENIVLKRRGRPLDDITPVKCYGFPDVLSAGYQNADFLADLQLEFEKLFANVYYLGPLRSYPKRQYYWSGGEPSTMGVAGESAISAMLASRKRGKYITLGKGSRKRTLEEHIAWWLKKLGLIDSFKLMELAPGSNTYQVLVKREKNASEVLLTEVGFGVSQVLPVLTLCFYVPEGSTIILEHPEIHLHPAVQSGLADMLIETAIKRNVQIIVESHSEYLLRRFQRRIAEDTLKISDIALFFCSRRNGESKLEQLKVDLYGDIENWPDDFFGDEFDEIASTQLAAAKRQGEKAE